MSLYLVIPVSLIIASLAGILVIIIRRLPIVKKVDDLKVPGEDFWKLMFIEFVSFYRKIPFREYRRQSLGIYEKILRMLKIASLKVENKTSKWLEKIPKEKASRVKFKDSKKAPEALPVPAVPKSGGNSEVKVLSDSEIMAVKENIFKKEERRLIAEIAKFPKNSILYKELGKLYIKNEVLGDAKEALKVAVELNPEDRESSIILRQIGE